jgi:hypothetical protein
MDNEEESPSKEKYTVRKKQKRSLLTSRSLHKRVQGRIILTRNWIEERLTFLILLAFLLFLLFYALVRHEYSAINYFPAQSEESQ